MKTQDRNLLGLPVTENVTIKTYISGFILSLIFTFIPYFLVINKTLNSSSLAAVVLIIAVIQMIIQIYFFLHLGRGPKPLYNIAFFISTVSIILVVVLGSIFINNNLHYNMTPSQITNKLAQEESIYQINGQKTGACHEIYANHKVYIKKGKANPSHIEARLCDTLTFINEDSNPREIAFGTHPEHINYAGNYDITVHAGYPKTITLNQPGSYLFHDHLDPSVSGDFNVAQ